MKKKIHNEHFCMIKKNKCDCEPKFAKAKGNQVYCWFEYYNVKRRLICHFCVNCYKERVLDRLQEHVDTCGCKVDFVWHGYSEIPKWLHL